ncbi:hypothetical protein [Subtercola sp. YIM 133946]
MEENDALSVGIDIVLRAARQSALEGDKYGATVLAAIAFSLSGGRESN